MTELPDDSTGEDLPADLQQLTELLYPELRRMAQRQMRRERHNHTLQTTALVHEAYLRLANSDAAVASQKHFLSLAAQVMRRVMIDHARGLGRDKRGGDQVRVSLTEAQPEQAEAAFDVLALDQALRSLQRFDHRRARLLELRIFGGLNYDEIAEILEISKATVHRELRLARAWLQRELHAPPPRQSEA